MCINVHVIYVVGIEMHKPLYIQLCPSLQRSYYVKKLRKRLNEEVEIVSVNGGAYRLLKKTLSAVLHHLVILIQHVYA